MNCLRVPYSCGVVSVFVLLAGNSFWYLRTYHTVVVLCQFFWFWWEIVFGVTYVHSVQYSCTVVFLKNDYSVSLFLEKQLASQNIFLVKSELSITTYLFLVFYESTSLQSQSFLKNIKIFLKKQKLMNNQAIPLRQQSQIYDIFSKNIETFSNLSVAIISQKYQEFSMQLENCA